MKLNRKIGPLRVVPGKIRYGSLPFEGHKLPLVLVCGRKPGPTLAVLGLQHPTEFSGLAAVDRVLADIDPDCMAGLLVCLPIVNPLQKRLTDVQFRRCWKKPATNLNRQWPGDP
jgi:predicted deacylase